jgi:hypothetical protein
MAYRTFIKLCCKIRIMAVAILINPITRGIESAGMYAGIIIVTVISNDSTGVGASVAVPVEINKFTGG